MRKKIHPPYQEVLFVDSASGKKYLIGSTLQTKEKEMFEGKEVPVCKVAISSSSHPFFTKEGNRIDSEGRIKKFTGRYERKTAQVQQAKDKQEIANKEKLVEKKKKR